MAYTKTRAQHCLCPFCGTSYELTPATTLPTASNKWKKWCKSDPAAVTLSDLEHDPESFVFED